MAWHSGNGDGRINEVTLCQAQLVLGWANHHGTQPAIQVNSASNTQRDRKWVTAKRAVAAE